MKYVKIDESGFPVAFYSSDVNKDIPADAFEISFDQWVDFISHNGLRKWNGSEVVAFDPPFNIDTCISLIKSLAGQVILSIAPDWKQRNMTARAVEIADAKAQGTATEADIAESEAIRAIWYRIKAVRSKSNQLELQYVQEGQDLTADDIATIKAELEQAGA